MPNLPGAVADGGALPFAPGADAQGGRGVPSGGDARSSATSPGALAFWVLFLWSCDRNKWKDRAYRPPFALIAGGRPTRQERLRRMGSHLSARPFAKALGDVPAGWGDPICL